MQLVVLEPAPQPINEEEYWSYKALWARVVIRALYDYVTFKNAHRLRHRRDFKSAEWWLFGDNTGFSDVCEVLGWPEDKFRDAARNMTKNDVRKLEHYEREYGILSKQQLPDGNGQ